MTVTYRLPKIISQTQKHARSLTKQHREATSSKLLHPRKVVMEVVPNVLQGFWLPPPNMSFNMPSQQLSKMAVGVTKAVEDRVATALSSMPRQVTFSRSIRDYMVLTVQEKFGQGYALEGLVKRLNGFEAEVLNIITGISAGEICMLFHSQSCTKVSVNMNYIKDCIQPAAVVRPEARTSLAEDEEPGLEGDTVPIQQTVAAVTSFPPVSLTLTAEPPISIGLHKTETQPVEVVESFNTTTGRDHCSGWLVSDPSGRFTLWFSVTSAVMSSGDWMSFFRCQTDRDKWIQLLLQLAATEHLLLLLPV